MSHEIYGESFVGSTPTWHGIGTVLGRGFSAEEAVKYGGLDFEVEKLPLFTQDGQQVDKFATVRTDLSIDDPNRILGIVGASYNIVQNRSVFGFFDEVVETDQAIYDAVGALNGGKQIFITAKIPMDFWVAKDKFETYTVLTAGHTGMHSLRVFCSAVRVVCMNTLNMALKQTKLSVSLRHTRNVHDRLLEAPAILGLVDSKFRETQELFQALANKPITVPLFNQYVEELFPSENPNTRTLAHRESVTLLLDDPLNSTAGIKHTWYSAAQGVIQYADHVIPLRKDKDRFESKMFGSSANLKKRAVDLVVKFAFEGTQNERYV